MKNPDNVSLEDYSNLFKKMNDFISEYSSSKESGDVIMRLYSYVYSLESRGYKELAINLYSDIINNNQKFQEKNEDIKEYVGLAQKRLNLLTRWNLQSSKVIESSTPAQTSDFSSESSTQKKEEVNVQEYYSKIYCKNSEDEGCDSGLNFIDDRSISAKIFLAKFSPLEREYLLNKGEFVLDLINKNLVPVIPQSSTKNLLDGKISNYEFVGINISTIDPFSPSVTFYYKDKEENNRKFYKEFGLAELNDLFIKKDITSLKRVIDQGISLSESATSKSDIILSKIQYFLNNPSKWKYTVNFIEVPLYEALGFSSEDFLKDTLKNTSKVAVLYKPIDPSINFALGKDFIMKYYDKSSKVIYEAYVHPMVLNVLIRE